MRTVRGSGAVDGEDGEAGETGVEATVGKRVGCGWLSVLSRVNRQGKVVRRVWEAKSAPDGIQMAEIPEPDLSRRRGGERTGRVARFLHKPVDVGGGAGTLRGFFPMKKSSRFLSRSLFAFVAAAVSASALLLSGCSSTKVEKIWNDPEVSQFRFKKILVVCTIADPSRRRQAEDTVRNAVRSVEVVTGYSVLADVNELKDVAGLDDVARKAGVDGIVIMRPVADRTELGYTPGSVYPGAYASLRDYWSPAYALMPLYAENGLEYTNRTILIETNIYAAATDKLLWSGTTETVNPSSVGNLVKETVDALGAVLREQKLIP